MLQLYFNTVRHLRPAQILGRVRRLLPRPGPDLRAAPAPRVPAGAFVAPVTAVPSLVAANRFRLLNVERICATAADWQTAEVPLLWLYNLHYFDDLNAAGSGQRLDWHLTLLERWVAENPPGQGVGWEPYPVSRRIVNWVKWSLSGNKLPPSCHESLAVQARWLANRLEFHLLGNHLFANAKALMFAGAYFDGPEAQQWLKQGMALVTREIDEQILADGAHFELSTMYHCAALEDLLDLYNLLLAAGLEPPRRWAHEARRMSAWLRAMSHPDGEIAFFNDAAFGIAPTFAELEGYAARLDIPAPEPATMLTVLDASGYGSVRLEEAYLACDFAAVGPDYLPGHAHADALSFELSLGGARVLVNSGTSQYGLGEERDRQRGTRAHNTVVVDDADSSETWAGFRVARRARARLLQASISRGEAEIEAEHDGYTRLAGRNRHRRRWSIATGSLRLEDHVSGEFRSAEARFHLHPDVSASALAPAEFALKREGVQFATISFEGARAVAVEATSWHPRFGETRANQCLAAQLGAAVLKTRVTWTTQ